MAEGLNKVLLIGNLGQKPELQYTQSGTAWMTISLATNERYKDKDSGEWQDRTEWHRIVVWSKRAEGLSKVLDKGTSIFVEGKLQTRTWENKEGKKNYTTEVVARKVILLGGKSGGGNRGGGPPPPEDDDYQGGHGGGGGYDDDVPF